MTHIETIEELEKLSIEKLEEMAVHQNEVCMRTRTDSELEKRRLKDILRIRGRKLNREFKWTESNKKKLLYLNDKLMECFEKLKTEATAVFQTIQNRINANDVFLNDFVMEANVIPFIYEYIDGERFVKEDGIEDVLMYNWNKCDMNFFINNADCFDSILYLDKKQNWNIDPWFQGQFEEYFISQGINDLYDHTGWSFSDILKINHLQAELNVVYQHSVELKE